jgi:neurotransmitter:Na+ symporter, NSS family
VFFSLSLAMAILIAYASYLPEDSDISNNVFISAFADAGIAFLAGLAVFSTLGYMAFTQNVAVTEVVASGVILAFAVFPQALSLLPGATIFAVLFFVLLVTFAIDSQFSLVESSVSAIMDKFQMKRSKAVTIICVPAFLIGIIFVSGGGLYWLDIVDRFVNNFGLVVVGLLTCIIVGHVYGIEKIRDYINETSEVKIGKWFDFCIKYLTPVVLIIILISSLIEDIKIPYEGYPQWALIVGGWLMVIALPVVSYILMKRPTKASDEAE